MQGPPSRVVATGERATLMEPVGGAVVRLSQWSAIAPRNRQHSTKRCVRTQPAVLVTSGRGLSRGAVTERLFGNNVAPAARAATHRWCRPERPAVQKHHQAPTTGSMPAYDGNTFGIDRGTRRFPPTVCVKVARPRNRGRQKRS